MSLIGPQARRPTGRGGGHYRSRSDRRRTERRRRAVAVLALAAIVVIVVGVRLFTEPAPSLRTTRLLASSVSLPGRPPVAPWPATGQGAFLIPGVVSEASAHEVPAEIASVAKVMTAYVVLRDHPFRAGSPGFAYTVTAADVADYDARRDQAESVVPVVAGEQLDEDQLLEGLLVPSGNNYADMLADIDAGTVGTFVARMNAAAHSLAMTSTTYTDPSGFESTTLSTAADQARLAAAVMADPVFATVVAEPSVTLPDGGTLTNFDTLVGTDGFVGIKTGSDATAGGCLMFASLRHTAAGSFTVYGAVLGQDVGTHTTSTLVGAALAASRALVDAVAGGVERRTVLPAGSVVERLTNAAGRSVTVATTTALTRVGWPGSTRAFTYRPAAPGSSVRAGARLATVGAPGGPGTAALATSHLARPGYGYRLRHLL